MKTKVILAAALTLTAVTEAAAGGILTNTNQSIDFLRNPARDGAIGLDGVYSNPAGVAFLPDGLHLGLNWQYARQTRTVTSVNPVFKYGRRNGGSDEKVFEGVADAPCIPSIQMAYNKGDWSLQFNFSVPGGGGSCEFSNGLGSFESVVGSIAQKFISIDQFAKKLNDASSLYTMMGLAAPADLPCYGVSGYDMDGYMQGRQYYFGFQIGGAYKASDNLSVYGGLRLLYGTATYKAKISNIMVNTTGGLQGFESFLPKVPQQASAVAERAKEVLTLMGRAQQAGVQLPDAAVQQQAQIEQGLAELQTGQDELSKLSKYTQGVNLLCNQSSVGVAPVVGIDYRVGKWNFAAKYEFRTQIRMKNESTVNEASEIAAVNRFRDGENINEDMPALATVGVEFKPADKVRLNIGYHHYFDKDASWYGNSQMKLRRNTQEVLAGVEWDVNSRLTVSIGTQLTDYGLSDEYMNDMSFVTDSYSIGFGANYAVSSAVTLKFGYFSTTYDTYDRTTQESPRISDSFTRTNRVLGIGCDITL